MNAPQPEIAVVLTCFDLGRTIGEALASVHAQTLPAAEVVIVDDGSTDVVTRQILAGLEQQGHRVVRSANRGAAAARNLGVAATSAPLLVFLDADDRLAPTHLAATSARLGAQPELDYVSTALAAFGGADYVWRAVEPDLPRAIAFGTLHVSTLLRRSVFDAVGGYDESLRAFEDLDFWTRVMKRGYRGTVLEEPLLHYRVRPDSNWHRDVGRWAELLDRFYDAHWDVVAQNTEEVLLAKEAFILEQRSHGRYLDARRTALRAELAAVKTEVEAAAAEFREGGATGTVDLGDLRRTTPLSPSWGGDRGLPIDRVYIEAFLERNRHDVRGRVLEIKDPGYTRVYGEGRVSVSDVLDVDRRNPLATIVADLAAADSIPDDTYDCFLLTQTLNIILDVRSALRHAHRILKPGGVLLCTVSALNRCSCEDGGRDRDYWRFTEASLRALLAEHFPPDAFDVGSDGNVLSCSAFLYGLAKQELRPEELEARDPDFPLVCTARAVKLAPLVPEPAIVAAPTKAPVIASVEKPVASRGVVLAYHRIVGPEVDSRGWAVSPAAFRAQMEMLRRDFRPMSLRELTAAAAGGEIPEHAVAVTLDDGYVDALETAAPILAGLGVPATFFATTDGLDAPSTYWWDALDRIFAETKDWSPVLEIENGGGVLRFATATPKERMDAYRLLTEAIYAAGRDDRRALLEQLARRSGCDLDARDGHRPLLAAELARLADVAGVEVGSHTRAHLCLPAQPKAAQRDELEESRRALEAVTGRPVTGLAYPYGEHDAETVRLVREAGYTIAVTVAGGPVRSGAYPLLVPRLEVRSDDTASLARAIATTMGLR